MRQTLDGIDDQTIDTAMLDRPIETIPDLEYTYGQLYLLGRYGGEGDEYTPYLTPGGAESFIGDENSLISVRVDLTGDTPQVQDVKFETYSEDLVLDVAHSWYSASGVAVDHSITHKSSGSGNEPAKLAKYASDRLTRWPNEDGVIETEESHRGGWVITALRELGEKQDLMDTVERTVENYLRFEDDGSGKADTHTLVSEDDQDGEGSGDQDSDENESGSETVEDTRALVTVQIKRPQDADWKYPGQVDVLQEAMASRRRKKMVDKNVATNASGEGVGIVTEESGTAVGVAADPLNYFLPKQQEHYPSFDANESWRARPVAPETALITAASEPYLEPFRHHMFGKDVYYLPYFRGEITPERARTLYGLLHEVATADEGEGPSTIQRIYRSVGGSNHDANLVFWSIVMDQPQTTRWDILAEDTAADGYRLVDVVDTHHRVLNNWVYGPMEELKTVFPIVDEDWSLLSFNRETLLQTIANGDYIERTFPYAEGDSSGREDSMRIRAQMSIVTPQRQIDAGWLIEQYVQRLMQADDGEGVPTPLIGAQFAQMNTLAAMGALTASTNTNAILTEPPAYMSENDPTETDEEQPDLDDIESVKELSSEDESDMSASERREKKLLAFIDTHPPLQDDERGGIFLLGVLVGKISQYQSIEGRGQTLADKTSLRGVTTGKIQQLVVDAIDKDLAYRAENRYTSMLFSETIRELVDYILKIPVDGWTIDNTQVQYYYSLGVSYGLTDYGTSTSEETASESEEEQTDSAAQAS